MEKEKNPGQGKGREFHFQSGNLEKRWKSGNSKISQKVTSWQSSGNFIFHKLQAILVKRNVSEHKLQAISVQKHSFSTVIFMVKD